MFICFVYFVTGYLSASVHMHYVVVHNSLSQSQLSDFISVAYFFSSLKQCMRDFLVCAGNVHFTHTNTTM